jgi:hypothetical protein
MGKQREAVWLELFAHIPVDTLSDYQALLNKNGKKLLSVMYKEILKRSGAKLYLSEKCFPNK